MASSSTVASAALRVGLGPVIGLLIFGVIQVLVRSRGRALRRVHERMEELALREADTAGRIGARAADRGRRYSSHPL